MPRRPHTPRPAARLRCEQLETREVPAVLLRPLFDPAIPDLATISNDKPTYLPVTVTNTPAGAVTTTVSSSNPNLRAEVVAGGRSIRFDVTGTDRDGVAFSGSLTVRLFEDAAPLTAQRLVDLVNSGFYANKVFHRIIDDFVIQGGSPDGTGVGGSPLPDLPDEYNPAYTFASNGIVAMANATDDNNDSQFFITDIDQSLAEREQSLNFNHTIVGILTDGFDTYEKIITTRVSGSTPTSPVTIVGAAVFTDTENAVVKLTPQNGFTGTAGVTVTASDGTGTPTTQTATVTAVNDTTNSKPFIATPVPDQTTTAGTPVTFAVPTTDIDGDALTVAVRAAGAGFAGTPANVTASVDPATGRVTITPNAGFTGTTTFKVGVRQTGAADTADNYDTQTVSLTVNPATTPNPNPTPNPTPNTGPVTAEGSAPGSAPVVTIRNQDGSVRFSVPVFEPTFTGGVRVGVADTDQDGDQDVIVTPGQGGAPVVLRIDPTTGQVAQRVMVFEDTFRGGLYLSLRDVTNLGYAQVLVGAGDTGGPRVTVLDLKRNVVLQNFFAGDANFRGGVSVDAGKVFESRGQTIVTGLGPGAGPVVGFFDPNTAASLGSFMAGDSAGRTGIRVTTGTADSSGVQPVLVAPVTAPDGTAGESFNADDFVDPNRPATTNPTTTGGGGTIDFESLFPSGSGG
ncbi:MAG: peptidylprolyl isomerase [Gemmataceae bacterium]|nr:peptidylprolyl isomerase [Gemmataceae bacterium]